MVTSRSGAIYRLIFCAVLLVPTMARADEPKEQAPSETETDQPTSTEPAPTSEGADDGVRSRAPGQMTPSNQMRMPGMRNLQVLKTPETLTGHGPAPTNFTVTPVTPTNLQVEWSPSPGAIRYLISRNGAADITVEANAGHLQGNRFLYTDIGRKPATLHTYSVTAHFNPPLLPGRSAAVQLVTPPALPPQNFKATLSGPNAVMLTWTQRPEATGYRIIRNGGNLPPTDFNASGGVSHIDQNLPPGRYLYVVRSVIRLATGEELVSELSSPITLQVRPFNIVAIGDSYMWGQGLSDQNKFARKVANWLQGEFGKPVNFTNSAHSGAVTYPAPDQTALLESTPLPDDHEVPWDFPTISFQARVGASALVPPNDVDLVLVNGCANNVGVPSILNPVGDNKALEDNTRAFCSGGMQNVLTDVARTFLKAKIVVTGYFPFITDQTDLAALVPFGILAPGFRHEATVRANIFSEASTSSLQSVVNTMNATPSPLGGDRFRYAPLPFRSENAYGGPYTWLWYLNEKDEVYDRRKAACDRWPDAPFKDAVCKGASVGHPNVKGAQAYTDAIKSVLTTFFLPEWKSVHLGSLTAPDDSLVVRVQPGFSEPGGGTLIVTASDGPAGPPLQGTIKIDGLPVGALGAPTRYVFRESNPTEILVGVEVPGRRPRFFTIPVRTLSVAVTLTNNSDPRTAIVTATDVASGEIRNGAVTVYPNLGNLPLRQKLGERHLMAQQVSGATSQPLTYPSCGQINVAPTPTGLTYSPRPVPCVGNVHVPYYPDISFQDVPDGPNDVIRLETQPHNLPQRVAP